MSSCRWLDCLCVGKAKAAQLDEMLWGKDGEKLALATVKQLNKERKVRTSAKPRASMRDQ